MQTLDKTLDTEMMDATCPMMIGDILKFLPHRYPFLLIDRVTRHEPGKVLEAYKNVSVNEPFFNGHFPGKPIMPGVLIIEAMCQAGALLVAQMPEGKGKIALFAGIDEVRFRRPVVPGDRLELKATLLKMKGPIGKAHGIAYVDGQVAGEGIVMFSLVDEAKTFG